MNRDKNNKPTKDYDELPSHVTGGGIMSDPMTSGYGKLFGGRIGCLFTIGIIVVPLIFAFFQHATHYDDSSDNVQETVSTTETNEQLTAADIKYQTIDIFDNYSIDIPADATEVSADEGLRYETADGDICVQVFEIPDPNNAYPDNIIDYCNEKGIDLQVIVDPDGVPLYYAEYTNTDTNGNTIFFDEDYQQLSGQTIRIKVESKADDYLICSHIFSSLKEK